MNSETPPRGANRECWPNQIDWVQKDPNAIVENIYRTNAEALRVEDGPAGHLDTVSHYRMETYLDERMHTDPELTTERTPITHEELIQKRKFWPNFVGWLRGFGPKRAVAMTAVGLMLLNGLGNADDVGAFATNIYHDMFPRNPIINTDFIPGAPSVNNLEIAIGTVNEQDKVQVVAEDIDRAADSIEAKTDEIKRDGGKIKTIEIDLTGGASDEYNGPASIGRPDGYNDDLAQRRAAAIGDALNAEAAARGLDLDIQITAKEYVLSPAEVEQLNALAQSAGYDSGWAAVQAVARGEQIDGELGAMIEEKFTAMRGALGEVTITSEAPGDLIPVTTITPNPWPVEPYDPHFFPFLWPVIPRLRRGWKTVQKTVKGFVEKSGLSEWLRVYPEGLETAPDEAGIERTYMREYPWQWTRKFQHLLRDDRIKQILRADYHDGDNCEQTLRVMFVDHTPTTETVATFQALLEDASMVQKGRLGGKISAIFIYPEEYAGRMPDEAGEPHKHPKKIALGVDTQRQANILGTTYPMLELVEMYMPTNPTETELRGFDSAAHTFAHELLGHGSDISEQRIILDPVVGHGAVPSLGRFASRDPWANRGANTLALYPSLADDSRREFTAENVDDTSVPLDSEREVSGARRTLPDRIIGWKMRALNHAPRHVRLDSHLPTGYSGAGRQEAYAESAAAVSTGMRIPYEEAEVQPSTSTAQHIMPDGYQVAEPIEKMVQDELGALRTPYELRFATESDAIFHQTTVDKDPLLGNEYDENGHVVRAGLAEQAKWRPVPPPEGMYEVRTDVTE